MGKKEKKFTNFQRKKTAEWLLNISQAILVAVVIGFFIPEIGVKVGKIGIVFGVTFSILIYILAMHVSREVKNSGI